MSASPTAEIIPLHNWGATPADWSHFDVFLQLTADLLPVVSNPGATISPESKMKALGKTPSLYNPRRHAVGFPAWTQHTSTGADVDRWSKERDFGISLQTRRVRAFDVDVPDAAQAEAIREFIAARFALPERVRATSSKVLVAFECEGDLRKQSFKTAHGIVEFLAGGNQFIAVGAHIEKDGVSRSRYEWRGGLPDDIPVLSREQAEALWQDLAREFGVEAPVASSGSVKGQKLAEVIQSDPVAQFLLAKGVVKSSERDGRLHIICPFEDEHSGDTGDSSTTYWPAHTGGYERGHLKCLHAHCEGRTDQEFLDALGYVDEDLMAEFSAIAAPPSNVEGPAPITDIGIPASDPVAKALRYQFQPAAQFAQAPPQRWLIKGVLPQGELGLIFGESGAGKSFAILDMAADLAMGIDWRGQRTRKARVAYVAAEGVGGVRLRLKAIAQHRGVRLEDLDIDVLGEAPNLMDKNDALDLARGVKACGAELVIVDTLAQTTPGGNENSGEDMGKAIAHCKGIHRATGAMVLLVHHSGKDPSKGARGWSGVKGALDVELEVSKSDDRRSLYVSKMKDGPGEGMEFPFQLQTVVLGLDEDGGEVVSCVVEHAAGTASVRGRAKNKLGRLQKQVLAAITEMSGVSGQPVPRDDVFGVVKRDMDAGVGRDTRNQRFEEAVNSLVQRELVVRDGVGLRLCTQESAP